ncbi:MAG: lamin tail domain-containing protein [Spirochaetes bacterium]|nr:lamin tail domain-containing protein [Spirochaetota bacterium]
MRHILPFTIAMLACSYPTPTHYTSDTADKSIIGIEIVLPSYEFTIGDEIPARCVALRNDGTRYEIDTTLLRWQSTNENVCSIIENKPRAAGRGTAILIAFFESFSAEKSICVIAPPNYLKLLISEVYYDAGTLADAEFIELWNTAEEEIDASGCIIEEGAGLYSFTLPKSTIIGANKKIVLPRNIESFFQEFKFYPELPSSQIVLGNSGETVLLQKPNGEIIDIVFFEGGDTKYPQTSEWCSSKLPNATKGNSAFRTSATNTHSCKDWAVGLPTPGY